MVLWKDLLTFFWASPIRIINDPCRDLIVAFATFLVFYLANPTQTMICRSAFQLDGRI